MIVQARVHKEKEEKGEGEGGREKGRGGKVGT
jgi:hypothetical protein